MAAKRLIVVVESTAAMGPYWETILRDYLDKIIRFFFSKPLSLNINNLIVLLSVSELSQFISLLVSITPLAIDLLDYSPFSILIVPNAYLASDDYFSHHQYT